MLKPTGIITPVRVNELILRECFCMLYAQQLNLFGMRAVLCPGPEKYREHGNGVPRKADSWQEGRSRDHEEPGR
jgi:hypothetical protein